MSYKHTGYGPGHDGPPPRWESREAWIALLILAWVGLLLICCGMLAHQVA